MDEEEFDELEELDEDSEDILDEDEDLIDGLLENVDEDLYLLEEIDNEVFELPIGDFSPEDESDYESEEMETPADNVIEPDDGTPDAPDEYDPEPIDDEP